MFSLLRLPLVLVALVSAHLGLVHAQQYAGDTIPNTLRTNVTDAQVAYFRIYDTQNTPLTLTNYYSAPNGVAINPAQVQRAIIVLHGANRDPWTYFTDIRYALLNASKVNPEVTMENVAIIAPYFQNQMDENLGFPYNASGSYTSALVWLNTYWSQGANNMWPTQHNNVSAFDVMDQLISYFDDATTFPQMKQILVVGHSMGGQMAHRYAAVGVDLALTHPLTYWIGNPDTYLWLNSSRPYTTVNCSTYNDFMYGLDGYTLVVGDGSTQNYNEAFVAQGVAAVQANYFSRTIAYAHGLNDNGNYEPGCEPYTQGTGRGDRFEKWMEWFSPPPQCTVDYSVGIGHNDAEMFASVPGQYRLFLDNWNGDGFTLADYGPRQVTGDNPHPTNTTGSAI